jgi:hypothetical protein
LYYIRAKVNVPVRKKSLIGRGQSFLPRIRDFKNAGYDFGRRGAHRAFQAEPILLRMIFKIGPQNDKQLQSQAIRIKA